MSITLGLFGANMGPCATAESAVRISMLAEELGYDSLWMGEHLVAPSPRRSPSPIEPDYPILDPIVTLAMVAAKTERIRLGTGIIILPQRNPVVLAKELATLDVLSGGRLIFGIGVGYLEPEMTAVGVPMAGRGRRADEYLAAIRSLWHDEEPSFDGSHANFSGVDAHPRPIQRPVPVVVGGESSAAFRRAVRHADGWYGFSLDRTQTADCVEALRAEAEAAGRDFGELEISVSPTERLDPDVVRDYAELGVNRLVVVPRGEYWHTGDMPLADVEEIVRANAPAQLVQASA
jgi:probable F420-dependent oxidoreductase